MGTETHTGDDLPTALEPVRIAINRAANKGPEANVTLKMADAMALIRYANSRATQQPQAEEGGR